MTPKIQGAVVAALLIGSAIVAASASGEAETRFHAETAQTRITGTQTKEKDTFTLRVNKALFATFVCGASSFEATTSSTTSKQLTVTPKYENCHTEGIPEEPVGVNVNGCGYLITFEGSSPVRGVIHLECEPGAAIEITALKCTFTIHPQTLGGFRFENTGSGMSRDVDMVHEGSAVETTTKGACEGGGLAELSGRTTMTGENASGESMGIWVE